MARNAALALGETTTRVGPASQDGKKGGRVAGLQEAGNRAPRWRWQPSFPPDAAERKRPKYGRHRRLTTPYPLPPLQTRARRAVIPSFSPHSRFSPSASEPARSGGDYDARRSKRLPRQRLFIFRSVLACATRGSAHGPTHAAAHGSSPPRPRDQSARRAGMSNQSFLQG